MGDINWAPRGWVVPTVGQLCEAENGRAFRTSEWEIRGLPIIRIENLKNPSAPFNCFDGQLNEKHRVRRGDLLFAWSGTPGTSFGAHIWGGTEGALNQHIFNIRFDRRCINPAFLMHALNMNVQAYVQKAQGGVGLAHITKAKFMDSHIRLAPRREQDAIVEALASLSSRLDEANAALERVQRTLKRYRAAVLQAAVEGRLVPTEAELARAEGRDYEPASELLKRILAERRRRWEEAELARLKLAGNSPKDDRWRTNYRPPSDAADVSPLPPGWCWTSIDQLAIVGTGATPLRGATHYWDGGSVPWVSSSVVNRDYVDEPTALVTDVALRETRLTLYPPGSLLVAMYGEGSTRGRVSELRISATTNQALAALVFVGGAAPLKSWVKLFLHHSYDTLRRSASGGVQPNLNLGIVRAIPIPLPPIPEQTRIEAAVDAGLAATTGVEQALRTNLTRSARLRESILKWAFEGKLVDQDPNDEPGSILLERIQQARAAEAGLGGEKPKRKARRAR